MSMIPIRSKRCQVVWKPSMLLYQSAHRLWQVNKIISRNSIGALRLKWNLKVQNNAQMLTVWTMPLIFSVWIAIKHTIINLRMLKNQLDHKFAMFHRSKDANTQLEQPKLTVTHKSNNTNSTTLMTSIKCISIALLHTPLFLRFQDVLNVIVTLLDTKTKKLIVLPIIKSHLSLPSLPKLLLQMQQCKNKFWDWNMKNYNTKFLNAYNLLMTPLNFAIRKSVLIHRIISNSSTNALNKK